MGGRYSLQGIGETPDVFEAIFEYPGFVATWSSRELAAAGEDGLVFYGTRRNADAQPRRLRDRSGARDLARGPDPALQRAAARVRPEPALRTTPLKEDGYEQVRDQFVPHVRNFVDCVKSRATPVSDLASSHRSSVPCHLANISMKLGRTLRWDEQKQDVVGDPEASRLLTKEYRSPWDRELRAALPRA